MRKMFKVNPFIILVRASYNLDNCDDNENAVEIMRHMRRPNTKRRNIEKHLIALGRV